MQNSNQNNYHHHQRHCDNDDDNYNHYYCTSFHAPLVHCTFFKQKDQARASTYK